MPVRSSGSSVLKWPDKETVDREVRKWAERIAPEKGELLRIGYFGSYARGVWGVGSDLDILIIVSTSMAPFMRRAIDWDASELPVPSDIFIYTLDEWRKISENSFGKRILSEVVWVYSKVPA